MKRILLFTSLVLVILGTMLTASAAPAALPVETAGENSEVVDLAAEGAVAADYTPTPSEYVNLKYGEVIAWEGYEGYEDGETSVNYSPAYINTTSVCGITSGTNMNIIEGVVSTDSESGKKFATVSGTLYRTFNAKKAASGKYTLVVRARKGGNNPKATLNFIIRNKLNGSDNNWLWPTFNLTDEFVEYSFSFNYTPSETNYVHQYMLYLSSQKVTDPDTGAETTVPYTAEIDSIAFYYKPFDDYERPQYGELIAWEGYETADIGSSANGSASVYNSNTTSGVTGIGFPGGTVYAEAPTGNRYIVTANTVYYPSIAPSVTEGNVKAKAGVYTHVVRARKGTGSSRHLASEPKSITVKHGTMVGVTQKHSH